MEVVLDWPKQALKALRGYTNKWPKCPSAHSNYTPFSSQPAPVAPWDCFQQMATRSNEWFKKIHTEKPKSVLKKWFENLLYRFFKQFIYMLASTSSYICVKHLYIFFTICTYIKWLYHKHCSMRFYKRKIKGKLLIKH